MQRGASSGFPRPVPAGSLTFQTVLIHLLKLPWRTNRLNIYCNNIYLLDHVRRLLLKTTFVEYQEIYPCKTDEFEMVLTITLLIQSLSYFVTLISKRMFLSIYMFEIPLPAICYYLLKLQSQLKCLSYLLTSSCQLAVCKLHAKIYIYKL